MDDDLSQAIKNLVFQSDNNNGATTGRTLGSGSNDAFKNLESLIEGAANITQSEDKSVLEQSMIKYKEIVKKQIDDSQDEIDLVKNLKTETYNLIE